MMTAIPKVEYSKNWNFEVIANRHAENLRRHGYMAAVAPVGRNFHVFYWKPLTKTISHGLIRA
jgi:hypothetical protein